MITDEEISRIIRERTGYTPVPPELVESCRRAAEGAPGSWGEALEVVEAVRDHMTKTSVKAAVKAAREIASLREALPEMIAESGKALGDAVGKAAARAVKDEGARLSSEVAATMENLGAKLDILGEKVGALEAVMDGAARWHEDMVTVLDEADLARAGAAEGTGAKRRLVKGTAYVALLEERTRKAEARAAELEKKLAGGGEAVKKAKPAGPWARYAPWIVGAALAGVVLIGGVMKFL